jgi:prolyl-tRNA synthetase
MKQSHLFTKTRREAPSDEVSKNAQLLIRAGYIHKEMAGVYTMLPLGLRVMNKVMNIIREEMQVIGGQEIQMTALQSPESWEKTGRFSDEAIDIWFKTQLKGGGILGLAPTHEEPLTQLMTEHISSHADLPRYVYQFQTKFRNETRAKSGIMRTREFIMKDLYSFSKDEASFRAFYEQCAEAYTKIFKRVGLGDITYRTFASGGSFSKFSDEFQTVCDAGEDVIYVHEDKNIAVNKEVYVDEVLAELGLEKSELVEKKAIEVGNIFPLGTRFSDALNLMYKNESGQNVPVTMGSYGIGPARLMGTVVECLSDSKGIVWPAEIAPFNIHLVSLDGGNVDVQTDAAKVYEILTKGGFDVLFDDRDESSGVKLKDADLIGIPLRVVVSAKTLAAGQVEVTKRKSGTTQFINESELLDTLKSF